MYNPIEIILIGVFGLVILYCCLPLETKLNLYFWLENKEHELEEKIKELEKKIEDDKKKNA